MKLPLPRLKMMASFRSLRWASTQGSLNLPSRASRILPRRSIPATKTSATTAVIEGDALAAKRTLMVTGTLIVVIQVMMACSLLAARRRLEVEASARRDELITDDAGTYTSSEKQQGLMNPEESLEKMRSLLKGVKEDQSMQKVVEEVWKVFLRLSSSLDQLSGMLTRADLISIINAVSRLDSKTSVTRCIQVFHHMQTLNMEPTMTDYQNTLMSFTGDTRFFSILSLIRHIRKAHTTPPYDILEPVLMSFCKESDVRKSLAMVKVISALGYKPSPKVMASVLTMMTSRHRNFEAAERTVAAFKGPVENEALQILVKAYILKDDALAALRHFNTMLENGNQDVSLAGLLLRHLVKQKHHAFALEHFDRVFKAGIDFGEVPKKSSTLCSNLLPHETLPPRDARFFEFGVQLLKRYSGSKEDNLILRSAITFTANILRPNNPRLLDAIVLKTADEAGPLDVQRIMNSLNQLQLSLHPWTYGKLLWKLARRGDHETVLYVHRYLRRHNVEVTSMALNAVLFSLAQTSSGDKKIIETIRSSTPCADAKSYAIAISHLIQKNCKSQAMSLLHEMDRQSLKPTLALMTNIADALIEWDNIDAAVSVCQFMLKRGNEFDAQSPPLSPSSPIPAELKDHALRLLAKCYAHLPTSIDHALASLTHVADTHSHIPPLTAYNMLLKIRAKLPTTTLDNLVPIYRHILTETHYIPDAYTFSALLASCTRTGDEEGFEMVLGQMEKLNVTPTEAIFAQMLRFFIRKSDPDGAWRVWTFSNSSTWQNPPISLLAPFLTLVDVNRAVTCVGFLWGKGYNGFDDTFWERFWRRCVTDLGLGEAKKLWREVIGRERPVKRRSKLVTWRGKGKRQRMLVAPRVEILKECETFETFDGMEQMDAVEACGRREEMMRINI